MDHFFLHTIDWFFVVFHGSLTLFNALGWIWKKTRKLNLVTLVLTGSSWFLLGLFYGLGYCPLTDWHFQVLNRLGENNLPASYIEYLLERFLPVDFSSTLVDIATGGIFLVVLLLSILLNFLDWRKEKRETGY